MMDTSDKVRLDKWLWAARFFKTRGLSADAIDGGKVRYDGEPPKPSKEVKPGALLRITRADGEWEVIVRAVSAQRRSATEAALLFDETEEGRKRRDLATEQRKAEFGERDRGVGRPTKRQRRAIKRFTDNI